ncbi:MAG TPA: pyridoxal phosphate-dependent aminotransferase [Thermodesulfovibrio thiophilus]|uniref:pyridoxal phosphate-dependent aminotransferase n=1 Tax=Thermodesulfovibrio thiophilus TaxID=340095 RepID=UPI0004295243|nr:pyridoxal phosphate-dependent aminotransferase [Thermodesulfovibrio thiophilus]HOA82567.1 pyridoxal phosphate-dependent aminotransferase [Thermodesulfovibrio thiophilus]HQA03197.1 pyridoxal phosphate-dependent aminotransferase [Thermodesulfovibrio thiophilus]HQD35559.1 pyridoxal phosphate-dependent aminotransferase [Thermodesulfovibrio thiophilus]
MIAERATKVKPSPTLAVDSKAKQLKAKGMDVVNFGVGEPDFDTPEHIKEAAIKAIKDGFTKYTPVGGIDELKEAIIEKLEKDNKLTYNKENIVVSCGAKHSLYNIAQALFGPGDEVIIPSPYWVSYPDQVLLNDAIPIIVNTYEEDEFMLRPEVLKEKITSRSKALILNSPSNPTGFIYTENALKEIAEIALKHNLYIISDEIYEKLIYDNEKHISIASLSEEIKEKTIVVNGLSKAYAMTGWRIGYAAGHTEIIKTMTTIQSQSTSNPTSIAQKAAVAALRGNQNCVSEMRKEFEKRRNFLVQELNRIPGVSCKMPKGAFYVFPNISNIFGKKIDKNIINSSMDLSIYLLEKALVALVPGSAFGAEGYIRISYATSMENLSKGIDRISKALEQLI